MFCQGAHGAVADAHIALDVKFDELTTGGGGDGGDVVVAQAAGVLARETAEAASCADGEGEAGAGDAAAELDAEFVEARGACDEGVEGVVVDAVDAAEDEGFEVGAGIGDGCGGGGGEACDAEAERESFDGGADVVAEEGGEVCGGARGPGDRGEFAS